MTKSFWGAGGKDSGAGGARFLRLLTYEHDTCHGPTARSQDAFVATRPDSRVNLAGATETVEIR